MENNSKLDICEGEKIQRDKTYIIFKKSRRIEGKKLKALKSNISIDINLSNRFVNT